VSDCQATEMPHEAADAPLDAGAGEPLTVNDIMRAAGIRNRNAADLMLGKMAAAGELERAGRGRYALPGCKIGKKEENEGQPSDITAERANLTNLTDLSAGGEMRATVGGG
jgi:hypothetical protein